MRYIGSKNLLLDKIQKIVEKHASGARTFCDIFSGTACVARHFKRFFEVYSNDLLYFSYCLQRATIENDSIPAFEKLCGACGFKNPIEHLNGLDIGDLDTLPVEKRFFQNNFSPNGGRMYVTDENALRIDFARNLIEEWRSSGLLTDDEYFYLVAATVEGIPFVSNISGTYGAYHKTWDKRAFKKFELQTLPVTTNRKNNKCYNEDGISLLKKISGDVLYVDPPYNSRQYLPNYHVLETAAKYDYPELRGVTGQREYGNKKSDFCIAKKVEGAFDELMRNAQFSHIILSYSTDGLVTPEKIEQIMKRYGDPSSFEMSEVPYRRFKSRDLRKISELKELIFHIAK